ncbi:MAG: tripartite tricarboxylate transporter TctB family protein [Sphaerochaetaceae bacterium]|nr:tripartite tricarboxylate transporter TctB family protein [Sphaerochaetaceae bacterium]MDC7236813.1 tripartite tricarboxylate transporter TctB family protein [Sphaerochaetaceae bacterium]MDC7243111.1 tripartite tricarboxylate transporter TctB family protein [Sphaerochaetaceae bacterium]
MNEKKTDLIIGIISCILGIISYVLTLNFPTFGKSGVPGPEFFPRILAILFLIISVIQISKSFVEKNTKTQEIEKVDYIRMLILIALFAFYILFLDILGFFITTIIFLMILQKLVSVKFKTSIFVTFIIIMIIFLIFDKLFCVSLPAGIIL